MTQATAHPDRGLISSEDVQGTDVYGIGDEAIGQIDHLLIEIGPCGIRCHELRRLSWLSAQSLPDTLVGAEIRHCPAGLPNRNHRIPIERRTRL